MRSADVSHVFIFSTVIVPEHQTEIATLLWHNHLPSLGHKFKITLIALSPSTPTWSWSSAFGSVSKRDPEHSYSSQYLFASLLSCLPIQPVFSLKQWLDQTTTLFKTLQWLLVALTVKSRHRNMASKVLQILIFCPFQHSEDTGILSLLPQLAKFFSTWDLCHQVFLLPGMFSLPTFKCWLLLILSDLGLNDTLQTAASPSLCHGRGSFSS